MPIRPLLWILALGLVPMVAGCSASDEASAQDPAPEETPTQRTVRVEALDVQATSFEDMIEITGTVEAMDDAVLSAQSSGTVTSLAPLGARVRTGQAVAQLDSDLPQAAVDQAEALVASAEAQLALAEDTYRRQEPLFRDSVISAIEFESVRTQRSQAEAQVRQAEAALAQARKQLDNAAVIAPFSGTVEQHLVDRGEQVAPGSPVARVVSTDRVKVTAGVPERYAADITEGAAVRVGFQAYGGDFLESRVNFAGRAINAQNRTFPIEIVLPNPENRFKPEMVARVRATRASLQNVLVIPQAAIVRDEGGTSVFIAVPDGSGYMAERRPVTLGPTYGGRAVVSSGLDAGDLLVVLGQSSLTDGDALTIVERYDTVGTNGRPMVAAQSDDPASTP
ncbi:MAG: efflux RND transporter periplasmic adaptor subunit [Bacteroidota bacterium]